MLIVVLFMIKSTNFYTKHKSSFIRKEETMEISAYSERMPWIGLQYFGVKGEDKCRPYKLQLRDFGV